MVGPGSIDPDIEPVDDEVTKCHTQMCRNDSRRRRP